MFKEFSHLWESNPGTSYPGHGTLTTEQRRLNLTLRDTCVNHSFWLLNHSVIG